MPDRVRGCLFDMDGVLTRTATVHAAAWKRMFDEFLRARAERTGTPLGTVKAWIKRGMGTLRECMA